jgi:hypothetical protein
MAAEIVFGVLVVGLLAAIAVTDWISFVQWVQRKGWREPKERIERTATDSRCRTSLRLGGKGSPRSS